MSPRRGTARPPIAVLWVSALASGSLAIHTTQGGGLARSWERPSLVGGLFYKRVLFCLGTTLRWSASKKTAYFKTIRQLHWRAPTTPPDLPPGWYGWPATRGRARISKVARSVAARSRGAASKIAVFSQKLLRGAAESGICGSTPRNGTGAIFGSATFSRD